jgi:hypothetical protein
MNAMVNTDEAALHAYGERREINTSGKIRKG